MENILYPEESYAIMGACFAVYKEKGCGFLEAVYQECLEIELEARGIPFVPQPTLHLHYRGRTLNQTYQPDFLCCNKIILEIKAVKALVEAHRAQTMNYLKATRQQLGILLNFGHYPELEYRRVICKEGRYDWS
jgi:GxxExxY protein